MTLPGPTTSAAAPAASRSLAPLYRGFVRLWPDGTRCHHPGPPAVRTSTVFTATGPLDFVNFCNGELVVGTSTTTGEETVLTDGAGGTHIRTVFRTSGT